MTSTVSPAPTASPYRAPTPGARLLSTRFLLRLGARLEGRTVDRFLPWGIAAVLFAVFVAAAGARYRGGDSGSELAEHVQAMWLLTHGYTPIVSITGAHFLADHLPVGLYPLAYLTQAFPAAPTLLVLQSLSLALGVVPLWRIARNTARLRVGAAATVALAYGCSPVLHNLNLADFNPVTVAVAPLLGATYYALRGHYWRFVGAAVLAVIWSAELGLVIAGLGAVVWSRGQRIPGRRIVLASLAWTILSALMLFPRYGNDGFVAREAFRQYGDGPVDVLWGMATHPHDVLADLLARESLVLVIGILAPLLFLPVLAPRYLVPAVPLQAFYLVADVPLESTTGTVYGLPLVVFSFVAVVFALERIGRRSIERVVVDPRVLVAIVAASVGFFCLDARDSPYERPWHWSRVDAVEQARINATDVVETLGEDLRVKAPPRMQARLADRLYLLDLDPDTPNDLVPAGADVVILDRQSLGWSTPAALDVAALLVAEGFTVRYAEEGIVVYARAGS